MDLSHFTIVSGIASILGLIVQLADFFPSHSQARNSIVFLICGVFIGSLFGAFDTAQIKFSFSITGYVLLVSAIVLTLVIVLLVAIFSHNHYKRGEMYVVLALGAFFLLIVLMFGSLPSIDHEADRIRNEKSSLSEEALFWVSILKLF